MNTYVQLRPRRDGSQSFLKSMAGLDKDDVGRSGAALSSDSVELLRSSGGEKES